MVAIDGPAGAGKSTVARALAKNLKYLFLDTGAIYRAVAWVAHDRGVPWDDQASLGRVAAELTVDFEPGLERDSVFVNGREVTDLLRAPAISAGASRVAAAAEVRAALLEVQRRVATSGPVVAEGRDCGTVVFPHAQAKFFLTASPVVRAHRRAQELREMGGQVDEARVLAEILERDERDRTRVLAPLVKARDAIEIDSGAMTPIEVVNTLAEVVRARGG